MLDNELVVLSFQGDKNAYAALVERYQRIIFGLAYQFLSSRAEAEEVAQEAFIRVYQQVIKNENLIFLPYIKKVVSNLCLDRLRARQKENRYLRDSLSLDLAEESTPENTIEFQEQLRDLRFALEKLPVMYREILLLFYVSEVPQKEIAQRLDIPLTIVKNRIFRGKRLLKDILLKKERGG